MIGRTVSRLSLASRKACLSTAVGYNFDSETQIQRVVDSASTFTAQVSKKWSIGDAPNGGFLMYLAIKAAAECTGSHVDPLSFTAYYVTKALEDIPAQLNVRIIGKTKSATTVHVTMTQDGAVRSEYMGTMGQLDNMQGPSMSSRQAPPLAPLPDCLNASTILRKNFGENLRIANETELRVPKDDPSALGLFRGKKGKEAALSAWASLTDKRPPCLASMAFFLDALPPPVLNVSPTNWVPTLEYTVHFWAKPTLASSQEDQDMHHWLRTTFSTTHVNNGLLYTDGEIWSYDGKTLLGTSRQLARVLEPRVKYDNR